MNQARLLVASAVFLAAACGGERAEQLRPSEDAALLASPGVQDVVRQAAFTEWPEGIVYDPPTPLAHPDSPGPARPAR